MPLFGGKKDKKDRHDNSSDAALKDEKVKKIQEENKAQQMAKQLSFNAQLAHGSPTVKISDFSNVKELYQKIAEGLNISITEVYTYMLNVLSCDIR